MTRDEILQRIQQERDYQNQKWGTDFDDQNTVNDWGIYINEYVARATKHCATTTEQNDAFIKVAALAIAAIETSTRNNGFYPRHYDRTA